MMTKSRVLDAALATCAAFACLLAVPASGNEVQLIDVRQRPADIGERTWFIADGATEADAIALRDQLVAEGAWNVNFFVQDRVVVCNLPPAVAAALSVPAVFSRQSTSQVQVHARATSAAWNWITDAYDRADHPSARVAYAGTPGDGAPFDDVVLRQTPGEVRAIQRELEASTSRRMDAPEPKPARNMKQNSELLTGSILANFIYTESDGSLESSTQNWSEDDQREAIIGATMAFLAWQSWTQMSINVTFNHIEGVATRYEPIMHDMGSDELWINDAMQTLGWGQHSTNSLGVVHEFNDAMRATYHTQWVVTSFIANARNISNHRFGGGNADYTAYANLGGPYMVEPFPAGTDPNAIGETLVFSKIVNHECGHCFWTLDEYPGAPGGCGDTSGYLDYANRNISMTGPQGEELRCEALTPCVMHTATRIGQDRPWCRYSLGHLGVIDNNNNGYPDVFEAAPRVVFEPEGPETLSTNDYTLRFKVVSQAVPNRNRGQDPDERVDYAPPVGQVRLVSGGTQGINLTPLDGHLDELQEDFEVHFSLAQVGVNTLAIRARNAAGYQSPAYTKTLYFAGVNYAYVGASVQQNRIEVAWQTVGDVFNSQFDIYRLDGNEAMPGTRIAQQVPPENNGTAGFVPYRYLDWSIQPGHNYQYYVLGSFTIPYEDSTRTYNAPSKIVGQTAAIPSPDGDFVSGIAPNPSNGNVTFSVNVPRTYDLSPRIPQRVATPVNVEVYDVLGRRVKVLADQPEFQDYITLRWDGRNEQSTPLPAGVYFVRVKAGEAETVRKLVLMR